MEKPIVYSKDPCVQCKMTYKAMDALDIDYTVEMLEDHPDKVAEFIAEGHTGAPVVEANGERWSGFQPDKIKALGNIAINNL